MVNMYRKLSFTRINIKTKFIIYSYYNNTRILKLDT